MRAYLFELLRFENDVNLYGTQSVIVFWLPKVLFENDVNLYGSSIFR